MKNFYRYTRVAVFCIIGVWLLLNLVGWMFYGFYDRVGIGLRLLGFLLWGAGWSLVPVVLAVPSVTADGELKWGAPLSWIRLVLLAGWVTVLIWAVEVPLNSPCQAEPDAEVMVVVGLFWGIGLAVGTLAVATVLVLLRYIIRLFCCRS